MPETTSLLHGWLERFGAALTRPEDADWGELFAEDCYWRDFVAFSWNIITVEGRAAIAHMARRQTAAIGVTKLAADPSLPVADENQGWFTFETRVARCRGLAQFEAGKVKVLITTMLELIGHEEPGGARRRAGVEHRAWRGRTTWADEQRLERERLGREEQPYCLIIGGGQNGLQLAARLRRLSVPTIVVDALERPGDCWRRRYSSLYLHDPIFLDHFPYLPFPDHWPLYTHKDKMAGWLEVYAQAMEINFWGGTTCTAARHDGATGTWTVTLERGGEQMQLHPRQFVLATGLSGAKSVPAIPGAELFAGRQMHSSEYRGGEDFTGRRCVVIGAGNSAHDICADIWEHGGEVTMVQRSPTIVVRAETMAEFSKHLPYANPAIPTDVADLMMATPFRLRYGPETGMTQALNEIDKDFYARLRSAGFQLTDGEDGTGFLMAYHRHAAGYYIEVGASALIARGDIAVVGGDVAQITADGVQLQDGRFLPADVIVYATGYRPMNEWVARLISPEVEQRVGRCWGLGSGMKGDPGPWEGELRNMWKPTAQEGLWFQGGNLMQARFHSLHLALQIKARMEGMETPVFPAQP